MAIRSNQTSSVIRAGVYTRISWDPVGQRAGVERQRVDCEALCADRGWEITEYYEDNDRSAYSGKRRPAYERMLTAVEERRLDAVVTWHNDRLHRSPRELEAFIDLVERSRVRMAVVTGGDYDLTTPEGRFTARIVGAVARKESEDRSRRVRRKHLELAEQGRPASHLGWGVRNEAERELVREAAGRVLAGQGLITISRDWNRRGVRGTTASPWTAPTLRKILLSARIAGLREHGADPRGRILGALTPAVWEGAIDRRTRDHVRAVLLNPERLTVGNTPTKYLLMGLIFCGVCGGRMFSRPRDDHTKRYVCAGSRPGHQLTIVAQPVDDLVAWRVLELLTTPAFREAVLAQSGPADDGSLGRALAALGSAQSRMQTLDDEFYVRGAIGQRRYRSIRTRLEREVDRLHTRSIARASRGSCSLLTPGTCGSKPTSVSAVNWCGSSSSVSGSCPPGEELASIPGWCASTSPCLTSATPARRSD
ncbi:MAG: recombinase family protein [Acidimicrobiales bacterium]